MLLPNLSLPRPSLNLLYDIHKLRDEMNRLFEGELPFIGHSEFPPINMSVNDDNIVVTAEIPGVDEQKINASVKNKLLNISGKREVENVSENDIVHRSERFSGEFSRTIELPARVNADAVTATYNNGVLKLVLPRAEEEKVKKIEIKSN